MRLVRDTRGGVIYVELLIMLPLISLLWVYSSYVHRVAESRIAVQRQARSCAWNMASGGCRAGGGGSCQIAGPSRLEGQELDQIAGTGLERVVRPIRTLPPFFRRQAGDEVTARDQGQVSPKLSALGGPTNTAELKRMTCNENMIAPQLPTVFRETCRGLLGRGGNCP